MSLSLTVTVTAVRESGATCPGCHAGAAPGATGVVRCVRCQALRHTECPCVCEDLSGLIGSAVTLPGGQVGYDLRDRQGLALVDVAGLREALSEATEEELADPEVRGEIVLASVLGRATRRGGVPPEWVAACESYEDLVALERACGLDLIAPTAEDSAGLGGEHGIEQGRSGGLVVLDESYPWVARAEDYDLAVEAAGLEVARRRLARGTRREGPDDGTYPAEPYQMVCDSCVPLAGAGGHLIDWASLLQDPDLSDRERAGAARLARDHGGLDDLEAAEALEVVLAAPPTLRLSVSAACSLGSDGDADLELVARCTTWCGGLPATRSGRAAVARLRGEGA